MATFGHTKRDRMQPGAEPDPHKRADPASNLEPADSPRSAPVDLDQAGLVLKGPAASGEGPSPAPPEMSRERKSKPRVRKNRKEGDSASIQAQHAEYVAREEELSSFISKTVNDRSAIADYFRSVREIWHISPSTWSTRIALTTIGAVCGAASSFAFSQTLALVGDAETHPILGAPLGTISHILGWFAGSLSFWYLAEGVQTRTDVIAEKHANEVDLTIYKSIRRLTGSFPEDVRQRKDVSELLQLVEHHEKSSKELVTGIINLSQEVVELSVTAGLVVISGGALGIVPVVLGGYLKYRSSTRCADREVLAEERANEVDIFYEDGDRALTTNSSISNLQLAHAHDKVVDEVAALKQEAARIRVDAFQKNERDSWMVARILEIPVAGSCLLFMTQWMSGDLSSVTCIWLMLSIWSVRANINHIGTLFSHQVADLKLASYRHAALDIAEPLGDRREKVVLDEPGGVTFARVRLRRRGSSRDTLKETSFAIEPGMSVAIVGNNGQGKSSLLGLISGRLLPTSGEVKVGVHDTRERSVFTGNLTQDYTLLAGVSVRANIERYRPPNRGMTAEEVVDLLGVREILCKNKPEGLDTIIPGRNQKSTNFSIGQRQLIALAQAVAAESGMLLLDEPLSALGPSMMAHISDALLNLEKRPTIFFVTHKYEQANTCDWVLVVDEGEVVEQGRPNELLLKRGGKYKALYNQQKRYSGRMERGKSPKTPPPVSPPVTKSETSGEVSFPA